MKMDKIAGSGNDEFYTPDYAVRPILKYVPETATIWCPFDTARSAFVRLFRERGNKVVHSHIADGNDFFQYTPDEPYDFVVSNPPYSLKNAVFTRLFELQKPFAMLVGVVGLFESQLRFDLFSNNPFEMLYLNKRVAYFQDYTDPKPSLHPPFSSVYLTSGVLPDRIVFEEISKT